MVSISYHPVIGRAIFAEKDFALGDIVFTEEPFMVAKEGKDNKITALCSNPSLDSKAGLVFHALASCSAQQLAKLSDFFFVFDEKLPKHQFYVKFCEEFHAKVPSIHDRFPSAETLLHAFLRWEINQHQYKDTSGVFELASKLAHSCSPNTSYSTDGPVPFRLHCMKPIAKGDMITISYINIDILTFSTSLRRDELHKGYFFKCQCDRCTSPDAVREIKCYGSLCGGGMLRSDDGIWKCRKCTLQASDTYIEAFRLRFETEATKMYFYLDGCMSDMLNGHAKILANLEDIFATAEQAEKQLGANHWLTARLSYLIFEICQEIEPSIALHHGLVWASWICKTMVAIVPLSLSEALLSLKLCAKHNYKIPELKAICKVFIPILEARSGASNDNVKNMRGIMNMCQTCGKSQASSICTKCKEARYCSKECQKKDWKAHKIICQDSNAIQ